MRETNISFALKVVGWVSIALAVPLGIGWIGSMLGEPATASGVSTLDLGLAIASAVSGVVFLALGAIVETLYEIEIHLRPKVTDAEVPKTGVTDSTL